MGEPQSVEINCFAQRGCENKLFLLPDWVFFWGKGVFFHFQYLVVGVVNMVRVISFFGIIYFLMKIAICVCVSSFFCVFVLSVDQHYCLEEKRIFADTVESVFLVHALLKNVPFCLCGRQRKFQFLLRFFLTQLRPDCYRKFHRFFIGPIKTCCANPKSLDLK